MTLHEQWMAEDKVTPYWEWLEKKSHKQAKEIEALKIMVKAEAEGVALCSNGTCGWNNHGQCKIASLCPTRNRGGK